MEAQFGNFAQCPMHGIKKMGPIIPSQVGDMHPEDAMFPMAVIGQFLDYRVFSANQIQSWINAFWVTNGEIKVERIGKIFFFYCTDIDDRDNLLSRKNANYKGALIVFKCWFSSASLRSFNFSQCLMWVRVEGIPLTSNKARVAERALKKLGRVVGFDERSLREGPKEFIRARVQVELNKPLVPGYFYEYSQDHFKWIDFRYEGIFIYCKKCGMVGHKASSCPYSIAEAQMRSGRRMSEVCIDMQNLLIGHPLSQCFTNKLIGLRRIEVLRTSRIDLTIPPSDEIPFDASFLSSPSKSMSSSSSPSEDEGPSNGNCSTTGKRPRTKSSSEDEGPRKKRLLWERRNHKPIAPINISIKSELKQGGKYQGSAGRKSAHRRRRETGGCSDKKRRASCSLVNSKGPKKLKMQGGSRSQTVNESVECKGQSLKPVEYRLELQEDKFENTISLSPPSEVGLSSVNGEKNKGVGEVLAVSRDLSKLINSKLLNEKTPNQILIESSALSIEYLQSKHQFIDASLLPLREKSENIFQTAALDFKPIVIYSNIPLQIPFRNPHTPVATGSSPKAISIYTLPGFQKMTHPFLSLKNPFFCLPKKNQAWLKMENVWSELDAQVLENLGLGLVDSSRLYCPSNPLNDPFIPMGKFSHAIWPLSHLGTFSKAPNSLVRTPRILISLKILVSHLTRLLSLPL